jgi:hypothetical protein
MVQDLFLHHSDHPSRHNCFGEIGFGSRALSKLFGPELKFYDISFGVSEINELDFTRAGNFRANDFTDGSPSRLNHRMLSGLQIIHGKGDMRKARPVYCGFRPFFC